MPTECPDPAEEGAAAEVLGIQDKGCCVYIQHFALIVGATPWWQTALCVVMGLLTVGGARKLIKASAATRLPSVMSTPPNPAYKLRKGDGNGGNRT